ncbi:RNA polymerase sigma-H factor [Oligella urethralis]|uniref:RNA polymerase sigma factor n=1 Tax=Oligella urethralis TaxID=90245 RepID=A0A2N6QGB8_9BURK|nr:MULTISPECIES: RNA polymerase sigma factor RpoE [Oligella]OFV47219.1 RNA polymerase sigma factor RpoE [Oligella sp. HMSC09E12]PMC18637.1 RNA polymerase sigma factor RpoE [Oligella urethralis]WOS38197.1 RNA polymerase sigma-H factor [Oligella urethralis]SPY07209.1 Sigma-24 [Oligella urethralis]SUA65039.1 Sigma-24 [Oligella urethralis]
MSTERELDAALVKRAQAGEKRAFELLVSKYQRRILRLLGRILYNQSDVEDVAQETFLKAYRALPKFRNESAFYTWLYRIAVNTARNHLSSKQNQLFVSDQLESQDGETFSLLDNLTDGETPETHMHNREILEALQAALDDLPEQLRQAIVLRELEGLSYEEIAGVMDCPVGTVRSRIFRAREAISERLKSLLGSDGDGRPW